MKFTKIKTIHKNKYEIHKNRTLGKKPGLTPAFIYWGLEKSRDFFGRGVAYQKSASSLFPQELIKRLAITTIASFFNSLNVQIQ